MNKAYYNNKIPMYRYGDINEVILRGRQLKKTSERYRSPSRDRKNEWKDVSQELHNIKNTLN